MRRIVLGFSTIFFCPCFARLHQLLFLVRFFTSMPLTIRTIRMRGKSEVSLGKKLSSDGKPPEEDNGVIKIDSLGINEPNSKFYTFKKSGQAFGAAGDEVVLPVSDWTIEVLCRRNGGALGPEHHLAGFQNLPVEGAQGIRLNLWEGPDDLTFSIHAAGGKAGVQLLKVKLEQDV